MYGRIQMDVGLTYRFASRRLCRRRCQRNPKLVNWCASPTSGEVSMSSRNRSAKAHWSRKDSISALAYVGASSAKASERTGYSGKRSLSSATIDLNELLWLYQSISSE